MSSERNQMGELSNDARAIMDAGRDADGASDFERARVRKALMAKIAAGIVFAQGIPSAIYCALLAAPMLISAVVLYWVLKGWFTQQRCSSSTEAATGDEPTIRSHK